MVFVKKLNLFPFIVLMQNESIKRVLKGGKRKSLNLTTKNIDIKRGQKFALFKGVRPRFYSKNEHFFHLLF